MAGVAEFMSRSLHLRSGGAFRNAMLSVKMMHKLHLFVHFFSQDHIWVES